jgi:protein-S-isoprenylcysteine O-methyltransferase Ste14
MTEGVAAIIWGIGLVAWFAMRLPYQRRARRNRVVAAQHTRSERLVLPAAGIGLVLIPAFYLAAGIPAFADYAFRPWMGWCGLLVEAFFLALFYASHRQLGRNWSVTLEIRDNHRLVTDGLYRYVRHPMYSSFWLWAIAQAFLLPNWVAGLSGIVGVGLLYFARVGAEEAMMQKYFGDEYRSYAARTGRVVPRIF